MAILGFVNSSLNEAWRSRMARITGGHLVRLKQGCENHKHQTQSGHIRLPPAQQNHLSAG